MTTSESLSGEQWKPDVVIEPLLIPESMSPRMGLSPRRSGKKSEEGINEAISLISEQYIEPDSVQKDWLSSTIQSAFQRNHNEYAPLKTNDDDVEQGIKPINSDTVELLDDTNRNFSMVLVEDETNTRRRTGSQVVVMQPMEIITDQAIADIENVDIISEKGKPMVTVERTWKDIVVAWVSVSLALIAGASIGPVFKYMSQNGIRPCLSASWRCQCMIVFLAPLAVFESYYDTKNKVDWLQRKPDLPFPVIVHILFSGLAWSGNLLFWIVGLQYTSTFMASVIACCHPILLVVLLRIQGTHVSWLEFTGVIVSFIGMIVSCLQDLLHHQSLAVKGEDSSSPLLHIDVPHQILGYILCLLAALCEVIVLFNRITTKKYVPLMQYTFSTTLVVTIMATISSLVLEGNGFIYTPGVIDGSTEVSIFCTHDNCVFGWVSKKWALRILIFGLWIGVFCIAGFNYALQFLSPLVFSALSLMDPALTAVLSWCAGIESLPTLYSWIGGAIVMTGVGIISFAGEQKH